MRTEESTGSESRREAPGKIYFFGDGSADTQAPLARTLRLKAKGPALTAFLEQVREALQHERNSSSCASRDQLPSFDRSLDCLITAEDRSQSIPALHPLEIVLCQVACLIQKFEDLDRSSADWPDQSRDLIIGLCIGELAASALSLSNTLIEFVDLGVDAVIIAFRAGLASQALGDSIEICDPSSRGPWSLSLPSETRLGDVTVLAAIAKQLGCTNQRQPYIVSQSSKSVTVGGASSTLRKIARHIERQHGSSISKFLVFGHMYSPYHANELFSPTDVLDLLKKPRPIGEVQRHQEWTKDASAFISGVNGELCRASSGEDLFNKALSAMLIEPIRWEHLVSGCVREIERQKRDTFVLHNVGPSASAAILSATLNKACASSVQYGGPVVPLKDAPRSPSGSDSDLIAIVGMSGRFPKAANIEEFWSNLQGGLDCHQVIPGERFNPDTHLKECAYGCFIDKPGLFDPRFFNMSPREALETDPAQRLALVTAYEALEMSGFVPNRTPSTRLDRVGTFFGQTTDEYKEQNLMPEPGAFFVPGTTRAFGPGRINHYFKFGGPSISVDTACSSSLVALQMAIAAVRDGECDSAVCGGMNILCGSDNYRGLAAGHFLSRTGGCKTFDDFADGYCRGEAVASVVVKRLSCAIADNDTIFGTILAIGTNHNALATSITRPDKQSQQALYRTLLRKADLEPSDITYIEAHGTGTQVGDATEISSIAEVFAPTAGPGKRQATNPLFLGAAKANVGHGESASGITSLVKSILVLQRNRIPPHIGIQSKLNHRLPNLEKANVRISKHSLQLPHRKTARPRVAMVNNFGAAGGNTALLLETGEARIIPTQGLSRSRHLQIVTVSAKTRTAFEANSFALHTHVVQHPQDSLEDISYTTTARRIHYTFRTAVVTDSMENLKKHLATGLKCNEPQRSTTHVAFTFTGQGAFGYGMGRQLFQTSTRFREDIRQMQQISTRFGFPDFIAAIDGSAKEESHLTTCQMHLALTALEIALARMYQSWGIHPQLVVGHSLGEYAALHIAGVLSLADTLFLVGRRAQLMEQLLQKDSHTMLSVAMSSEDVARLLHTDGSGLEIAVINTADDTVLSGTVSTVSAFKQVVESKGLKAKVIEVPYGFHSSQMSSIEEEYEKACQQVDFCSPSIPVLSPLLGTTVTSGQSFSGAYLRKHLRERVNFLSGLRSLKSEFTWLEVGPKPLCLTFVKKVLGKNTSCFPTMRPLNADWDLAAEAVAALFAKGIDIDWSKYHESFEESLRMVVLPSYVFDEQDLWVPYRHNWLLHSQRDVHGTTVNSHSTTFKEATLSVQKLSKSSLNGDTASFLFESDLASRTLRNLIEGHAIEGTALCPGSLYADMAMTVGFFVSQKMLEGVDSNSAIEVSRVEFTGPAILSDSEQAQNSPLQIQASSKKGSTDTTISFTFKQRQVARATAKVVDARERLSSWVESKPPHEHLWRLQTSLLGGSTQKYSKKLAYKLFSETVIYSAEFQAMYSILFDTEKFEAAAELRLDGALGENFFCCPYWIDGFTQIAGFVLNAREDRLSDNVYICSGWESLCVSREINPKLTYHAYAKVREQQSDLKDYSVDVFVLCEKDIVAALRNVRFHSTPRAVLRRSLGVKTVSPTTEVARTPIGVNGNEHGLENSVRGESKANDRDNEADAHSRLDRFRTIISRCIGVKSEELTADHTLAELGVDSLMSLSIADALMEEMGLDVNIAHLSGSLRDAEDQLGLTIEAEVHTTHANGRNGSLPDRLPDKASVTRSSRVSHVLQGDPKLALRSLFLLPDGSGTAASYARLPSISDEFCVYGLSSPHLEHPERYDSVEKLSKLFCEEIRLRQRHGPYLLAGWSAGGYYAFEVTKLLMSTGEAVEKLILIDSPCRTIFEAMPPEVLEYLVQRNIMGTPQGRPSDWVVEHFQASIRKIADYHPTPLVEMPLKQPQTFLIWAADVVDSTMSLEENGLDPESQVTRLLLKARDCHGPLGWDSLLPESGMWVTKTPGHHFQIVNPPHVRELADLIAQALQGDGFSGAGAWTRHGRVEEQSSSASVGL